MTRRDFLRGAGVAAGALVGAGCGVGPQSAPKQVAQPIARPKIDGDLLIFNWTEYMNPAVIKRFAKRHGVEVSVSNFDSMQAMMAKLRSGNRYDLIFPTADYVARLNRQAMLRPLDRAALRNSDGIYDFFDDPWYPKPIWRACGASGLSDGEALVSSTWPQGSDALSMLIAPERLAHFLATPPAALRGDVLARVAGLFGDAALHPDAFLTRAWGVDPFTQGYVAQWAPGDLLAVGPLHGTHEPPFYVCGSDHWVAGFMEGAVRTGRAAAAAALTATASRAV